MSDVILVLGMHRSGTSATAGVLTKLGGGAPKHLMGADPSNQRGYFESDLLTELNDKLLVSAGSKWSDWRRFNPDWYKSPVAADFRRAAKELFVSEFEGSSLPVFKDPRICRIAPFWLDVLRDMNAVPHVVIPVRSPLEVTKSLGIHRGYVPGLSTAHTLLLWLRHVLDAELYSRSLPRSIFNWREFRADWRSVCEKISTEAQISWSRMSDRAAHEIDLFLSEELVHHDKELTGDSEVHEWTRRTYEALMELSRNPLSNSALATLDDVRAALDQSSRIFGRLLIENELEVEAASGQISALTGEVDTLKAREIELLAEKATAIADLLARAERAEAERANVADERDALQSRFDELCGERDALGAEVADFAARAERAEAEATAATRDKTALSVEMDSLREQRARLAAELDAWQRELTEHATAVAELAARAERAEARAAELAHGNTELSEALAASRAERAAFGAEHAELAAALQAQQRDLAERTAAVSEQMARAERAEARAEHAETRAERAEARAAEVAGDNERLLRDLDAIRSEHAETAAELQAHRRELSDLAARAQQAEEEARAAAREGAALSAELESLRVEHDALDAERTRMAGELQARRQELRNKTLALSNLAGRAEQAEEREAARGRAVMSHALAAMQKTHTEQLDALRFDLIDTQAALARASATNKGIVSRLTPAAFARRRIAKALLRSGLFDVRFYLQRYPNAVPGTTSSDRHAGLAAAEHYAEEGYCRGYFPNEFFDTHWYIERYEDVRRSGMNPLLHYYRYGVADGRDPGPNFDTVHYLNSNPDVRDAGIHPLVHYLRHGRTEGRAAVPPK
jgi:hypothetical protein